MKTTHALTLAALMAATSGCDDEPKPPTGPSGPVLSEQPLWSLEQDTQGGTSCFGGPLALGDVNGDGRKDLVAARPSCGWVTPDMGRVALYAGTETFFSDSPVQTEVNWQNTSPRTTGRSMSVAVGNVNGDAFADVLVRGNYGVLVFTGQADLHAVFSAPAFRVPGNNLFGTAYLDDFNGDGLDDLVSLKAAVVSIFLATPQTAGSPFTLARTVPAISALPVGDTNGDGAADLLIEDSEGVSQLYLGCKAGSSRPCEGPVTVAPAWSLAKSVQALFPDVNGDGLAEAFVGEYTNGRTWLHLSDKQTGGISATPVWSVAGDPVFPSFGADILPVGDLDGDGQSTEFVITAAGRAYLYMPQEGISEELRPVWAWPNADSFEGHSGGLRGFRVVPAGDLDGDERADLLVGRLPAWESSQPGRVYVLGGGRVPEGAVAPFLPEKRNCIAGSGGKPDLTVDGDVLGRSLYIERKHFSDTSCEVLEGCVAGTGERRLLRFSVSIPNMGTGEMRIPGPDSDPSLYQYDSCHAHHHLTEFASYELRDARNTVTATGRKQGFYLIDFAPYCMDAAPPADFGLDLGVSPGWADIYTSDLPCQWLDITGLPDGEYSLRVAVDTRNIVDEQDTLPNHADVKLRIQGDSVKLER